MFAALVDWVAQLESIREQQQLETLVSLRLSQMTSRVFRRNDKRVRTTAERREEFREKQQEMWMND